MPPRKRAPSKAASAKSTAKADEPTPVDPNAPAPLDPYERVEVELPHGASVVPRPGGHTYLWPLDGGTIEVDPADLDLILQLLGEDAVVHRTQIDPPLAPIAPEPEPVATEPPLEPVAPEQHPIIEPGDVGPAVVEAPAPAPVSAVVEVVGPNVVEVPLDSPDDA